MISENLNNSINTFKSVSSKYIRRNNHRQNKNKSGELSNQSENINTENQKNTDIPNECTASKSTNVSNCSNMSGSSLSADSNNFKFSINNIIFNCADSASSIENAPRIGFEFKYTTENEKSLYVDEYLEDIYLNFLEDEQNISPKPQIGYMNYQIDINEKMRAILVDWLIDVHHRFKFKDETLYQTTFIIDTYLTKSPIERTKFQLLGIAALLIACKSQEIYYPRMNEFINITDNAYTKNELIEMEENILKVLNFNILAPTCNDFYNIIAKAFNFNEKQYFLGKYFLECCLIDYGMIKYNASVLAVACSYIVIKFFGIGNYEILYSNGILKTECPEKLIKEVAKAICFLVKGLYISNLKSIKEKYSSSEFHNVAQYAEQK